MSDLAIRVDKLSKLYRIGDDRTAPRDPLRFAMSDLKSAIQRSVAPPSDL